MKMVEVIVTGTVSGTAPVVPYSHEKGLQFYVTSTGVRTNRPVVYEIPTYEVEIKGGDIYDAVRFGLRKKLPLSTNAPATRAWRKLESATRDGLKATARTASTAHQEPAPGSYCHTRGF